MVKNFQITNFQVGVYAIGLNHGLIENIITSYLGRATQHYNGHGIVFSSARNSKLKNSVAVNAVAEAISVRESTDNILEGNSVYSNDDSIKKLEIEGKHIAASSSTDYYFVLVKSSKNTIRNNYIHRVGNLAHGGHGFSMKDDCHYNLFENNTAINLAGDKNIKVVNARTVFFFHWYFYRDSVTFDNTFENIDVDGASLLIHGEHFSKNNVVKNSTLKNIKEYLYVKGERKPADIEMKFQNVECVNCNFTLPK